MAEDHQFPQVDHHHASLFSYDTTMKARFSQIMGAASALAVCAPQSEALADNLFLKLEPLQGDSVVPNHKGEIEILSFSMGHSRPFTTIVGGGVGNGAAQPSFSDVHIQAPMSSLSPKLAELCATGKAVTSAKLSVQTRSTSKDLVDSYVVELKDVHITSFQTSAEAGGTVPTESFSLSFSKITWIFHPPNGSEEKAAFDLKTGTP
jgi:type VI secretion system secreted protein Hcp